jgi:hypothetical protein
MTLDAEESIRRFLLHTLPPGFQRIRYFVLMANRHPKQCLALCQHLLIWPQNPLLPRPHRARPGSVERSDDARTASLPKVLGAAHPPPSSSDTL